MRPARLLLAALLAALAACSKKPEPAAAPAQAPAPAAAPFTLRDLAAATALDARLARLTLAGDEVQRALPAEGGVKPAAARQAGGAAARARAKALLPAVDAALAEVRAAAAAIGHPLDRPQAEAAAAAARTFAARLAPATDGAPGAEAELLGAREALGRAIVAYRGARVGWRLDAPEPVGAERQFAEARRDLERIETAFGSRTRVAPREDGHEFDAAAARMTGQMAARRAKAAAEQLGPTLREAAVRHADAQERALEAVMALQDAPEAERPALARRHHAAKAEALAALADYFDALSAR